MRLSPALLASVYVLTACGGSEIWLLGLERTSKDDSEDYQYEFSVNGCSTGKHSFSSKDDYCKALQDDGLNHGCAKDIRRQTHDRECK